MSKEQKHTPGPWGYEHAGDGDYIVTQNGGLGMNVACAYRGFSKQISGDTYRLFTNENAEANARLIAAAPELLAMLEAVADYWDSGSLDITSRDIDGPAFFGELKATIYKAKG